MVLISRVPYLRVQKTPHVYTCVGESPARKGHTIISHWLVSDIMTSMLHVLLHVWMQHVYVT